MPIQAQINHKLFELIEMVKIRQPEDLELMYSAADEIRELVKGLLDDNNNNVSV